MCVKNVQLYDLLINHATSSDAMTAGIIHTPIGGGGVHPQSPRYTPQNRTPTRGVYTILTPKVSHHEHFLSMLVVRNLRR